MRFKRFFTGLPAQLCCLCLSMMFLAACEMLSTVPDGRIKVKNDSQDREYNTLQVYGGGLSLSLEPGESELLPAKTSRISFRRQYKDYVREYEVSCPEHQVRGITIKLLDVHLNRISGGCKTTSATKF